MLAEEAKKHEKQDAAHQLLAKNFPNLGSSSAVKPAVARNAKIPTDPVKLSKYNAVQLMKMKTTAIPADPKDKGASISPQDRTYIRVSTNPASDPGKAYWVRKVGRCRKHQRLNIHALDLDSHHWPGCRSFRFSNWPSDQRSRRYSTFNLCWRQRGLKLLPAVRFESRVNN